MPSPHHEMLLFLPFVKTNWCLHTASHQFPNGISTKQESSKDQKSHPRTTSIVFSIISLEDCHHTSLERAIEHCIALKAYDDRQSSAILSIDYGRSGVVFTVQICCFLNQCPPSDPGRHRPFVTSCQRLTAFRFGPLGGFDLGLHDSQHLHHAVTYSSKSVSRHNRVSAGACPDELLDD
ncbi:hypothetical protein Tco_0099237 [Tanacetum coccineum]